MKKMRFSIALLSMLIVQSQSTLNAGSWAQIVGGAVLATVGAIYTKQAYNLMKNSIESSYLPTKFSDLIGRQGIALFIPSFLLTGAGIYIAYKSFEKKKSEHPNTKDYEGYFNPVFL